MASWRPRLLGLQLSAGEGAGTGGAADGPLPPGEALAWGRRRPPLPPVPLLALRVPREVAILRHGVPPARRRQPGPGADPLPSSCDEVVDRGDSDVLALQLQDGGLDPELVERDRGFGEEVDLEQGF